MRIPFYRVNSFTNRAFGGNPAGVCPLQSWLPDATLQRIATENNLSETAFLVRMGDDYELRWFTPAIEVDLCGHGTLASAFVLFSELGNDGVCIRFHTRSGWLAAARRDNLIELDFPAWRPTPCPAPEELVRGLGRSPREVLKSRDFVAVYDSQADVAAINPDMGLLTKLDCLGVIVTSQGDDSDFVSRFFAPKAGVPEDPVTGSAHSSLIPFWAERLHKTEMFARQISQRGGELYCKLLGERVATAGRAVIYCRGELEIP
jgi:predicted PhzF superfamily epimerase YddE/YHI9